MIDKYNQNHLQLFIQAKHKFLFSIYNISKKIKMIIFEI
jgi:hypothetical protein